MVVAITVVCPWKSAMNGKFSTRSRCPWAARTKCIIWLTSINIVNLFSWNAARKRDEMLELYEGKPSRTVLRRESGSNPTDLAGTIFGGFAPQSQTAEVPQEISPCPCGDRSPAHIPSCAKTQTKTIHPSDRGRFVSRAPVRHCYGILQFGLFV